MSDNSAVQSLITQQVARPYSGPINFGPTFEAGTSQLHQGGSVRGLSYTISVDSSQVTEDMLLFKAAGDPAELPMGFLESGSPRATTQIQTYGGTGFTSRADFQTNAWSTLSPPSGRTTYYLRAKGRRGSVSDHSALADALAEGSPSYWLDHFVHRDNQGNILNEGWVYVIFGSTVNGVLHRTVHQFLAATLSIPAASGTVSMEPITQNPPSLEALCDNTIVNGMHYSVCAVEATVVTSSNDLTGSSPSSPSWPSGGATENT